MSTEAAIRSLIAASRSCAGRSRAAPGANEPGVIALQHAGLFSIERKHIAPVVEIGNPGVERAVQVQRVVVTRQQRRDVPLDGFDFVRRVGAGQHKEHARYAFEGAATSLKRSDRVLEIRRRRIFGDRVDFDTVIGQGSIKRRAEIVGLDRLKWREFERSCPFRQQGVLQFSLFHLAYIGAISWGAIELGR